MVLVVLFAVLLGVVLILGWVKLVNMTLNPIINWLDKKHDSLKNGSQEVKNETVDDKEIDALLENPYISAHLIKEQNDKEYDDYIKWLDKKGGDMPVKKRLTREEFFLNTELKTIYSKRLIK